MRKWLAIFFVILVLLFALPYVLIPNKIQLEQKIVLPVNAKAFSRTILEDNFWRQWWPGKPTRNTDSRWPNKFLFGNYSYQLIGKQLTSQAVMIESEKGQLLTRILYIPMTTDSVLVDWQGVIYPSSLPWARVSHYYTAKELENDWKDILQKMNAYYSKEDNVYELKVEKQKVKDSNLISTTIKTGIEPTTEQIYGLLDQLDQYAKAKGAKVTGLPMLNVTKMVGNGDSVYYRTQVALPVDRQLPNEGQIAYKWMLPRGNILVTKISGGSHTIQKAFERMENYVNDHNHVSPAIPFQSLITDRRNNPDTSKWITSIYWPVM